MYEQGLMIKVSNPDLITFLNVEHDDGHSNTEVVEKAVASLLGIPLPQKEYRPTRAKKPNASYKGGLPVKILDRALIDEVCQRKDKLGISHAFTISKALSKYKEQHDHE